MQPTTASSIPAPRLLKSEALLIFGLSQHYECGSNAGIPLQWNRFLPYFGNIPRQIGRVAYGVIYNCDDAGNSDYLCGVEVAEFPSEPAEFTRLRIPAQTYAVFEHRDHISTITATWKIIWEQALAGSGYQATDGPFFERYGEQFDGRTGLGGVELWVPVKV